MTLAVEGTEQCVGAYSGSSVCHVYTAPERDS
jgi:hypothetical protein